MTRMHSCQPLSGRARSTRSSLRTFEYLVGQLRQSEPPARLIDLREDQSLDSRRGVGATP